MQVHTRGKFVVDSQFEGIEHDVLHLFGRGVQVGLRCDAGGDQFLAVGCDAVFRFPGFHLFFGTVRRSVGRRVAAVTVRQHVDQYRAVFFLFEDRFLTAVAVDHGQRVEAVHAFCVHLGRVDAGADAGREVEAHRFAAGLTAHAVLVIHDVDDHRQAAFHIVRPQLFELIHRSEGHAFPNRAAGHRRVAEVGNHHARLAVHFLVQGRTYCDAAATAYDGVVRVDAERREEGMHTSAEAFVEPGRAGEYLGQRAVQQEADTQFFVRNRP